MKFKFNFKLEKSDFEEFNSEKSGKKFYIFEFSERICNLFESKKLMVIQNKVFALGNVNPQALKIPLEELDVSFPFWQSWKTLDGNFHLTQKKTDKTSTSEDSSSSDEVVDPFQITLKPKRKKLMKSSKIKKNAVRSIDCCLSESDYDSKEEKYVRLFTDEIVNFISFTLTKHQNIKPAEVVTKLKNQFPKIEISERKMKARISYMKGRQKKFLT